MNRSGHASQGIAKSVRCYDGNLESRSIQRHFNDQRVQRCTPGLSSMHSLLLHPICRRSTPSRSRAVGEGSFSERNTGPAVAALEGLMSH